MKKLLFSLSILLCVNCFSQGINVNNILGSYSGYQHSYSLETGAIVPGITYNFILDKGQRVYMRQAADNGMVANYKGLFRFTKKSDSSIVLVCNLSEVTKSLYPSKPTYRLTFTPDTLIICEENYTSSSFKSPIFHLTKENK